MTGEEASAGQGDGRAIKGPVEGREIDRRAVVHRPLDLWGCVANVERAAELAGGGLVAVSADHALRTLDGVAIAAGGGPGHGNRSVRAKHGDPGSALGLGL